ncbi:elongation factor 1-beta-like [Saccoglossus kowalevskii]|uniref:Elongation factor 1-beta-like n=1 Tax=Saccoglossus kowalevskii TaxID=10224 RepID=A0ABM0H1J3_SACKO|nr:PREDICTED: elongation factor 1-beta-like [Saccoglossus kowalevskii]
MGFGDLKSQAGQKALNDFLADRSYIDGYSASQADVVVYQALSGAPSADLFHALRWYNQIKSYASQFDSLPGVKKPVSEYGPAGVAAAAAPAAAADDDDDDDDDDDVDLFGSDDEEEAEKLKAERIKKYNEKKAKKPTLIAKSMIILDVKPWGDDTDMKAMEEKVRTITSDGLVWGASKLVPVGYGIKKLQISCVVEDDKVGTEFLEDNITAFEDYVQSVDIAAFNKL